MARVHILSSRSRAALGMAALVVGLSCAASSAREKASTPDPAGYTSTQSGESGDASALALRLFPMTGQEGITFAQVTDRRPLDLSRSGGRVGFVWAGHSPDGEAVGSHYLPEDRDLDRSHTAQWYVQHAPDQIAYKCDRTTPAPVFTYAWGFYAPIDTTNPAVRNYVLHQYIVPALRLGEKVIALDNVSLRNGGSRCGVYRNGQWVQLFSGEPRDPAYAAAVLDWVGWLANQIHAHGGLLALNAKVDPNDVDATRKLISLGDIWLEEAGFTRDCKPRVADRDWHVKMQLSQWAAARMPWISVEKSCASPAELSADEAQWIVGNFLLAKNGKSYLAVVHDGDRGMVLRYPRSLNPPVGTPQGAAFAIPGDGMGRRFSRGLVVVNPNSATPLGYSVPPGTWSTIAGAPVSGKLVLAPTSAAIFLSR